MSIGSVVRYVTSDSRVLCCTTDFTTFHYVGPNCKKDDAISDKTDVAKVKKWRDTAMAIVIVGLPMGAAEKADTFLSDCPSDFVHFLLPSVAIVHYAFFEFQQSFNRVPTACLVVVGIKQKSGIVYDYYFAYGGPKGGVLNIQTTGINKGLEDVVVFLDRRKKKNLPQDIIYIHHNFDTLISKIASEATHKIRYLDYISMVLDGAAAYAHYLYQEEAVKVVKMPRLVYLTAKSNDVDPISLYKSGVPKLPPIEDQWLLDVPSNDIVIRSEDEREVSDRDRCPLAVLKCPYPKGVLKFNLEKLSPFFDFQIIGFRHTVACYHLGEEVINFKAENNPDAVFTVKCPSLRFFDNTTKETAAQILKIVVNYNTVMLNIILIDTKFPSPDFQNFAASKGIPNVGFIKEDDGLFAYGFAKADKRFFKHAVCIVTPSTCKLVVATSWPDGVLHDKIFKITTTDSVVADILQFRAEAEDFVVIGTLTPNDQNIFEHNLPNVTFPHISSRRDAFISGGLLMTTTAPPKPIVEYVKVVGQHVPVKCDLTGSPRLAYYENESFYLTSYTGSIVKVPCRPNEKICVSYLCTMVAVSPSLSSKKSLGFQSTYFTEQALMSFALNQMKIPPAAKDIVVVISVNEWYHCYLLRGTKKANRLCIYGCISTENPNGNNLHPYRANPAVEIVVVVTNSPNKVAPIEKLWPKLKVFDAPDPILAATVGALIMDRPNTFEIVDSGRKIAGPPKVCGSPLPPESSQQSRPKLSSMSPGPSTTLQPLIPLIPTASFSRVSSISPVPYQPIVLPVNVEPKSGTRSVIMSEKPGFLGASQWGSVAGDNVASQESSIDDACTLIDFLSIDFTRPPPKDIWQQADIVCEFNEIDGGFCKVYEVIGNEKRFLPLGDSEEGVFQGITFSSPEKPYVGVLARRDLHSQPKFVVCDLLRFIGLTKYEVGAPTEYWKFKLLDSSPEVVIEIATARGPQSFPASTLFRMFLRYIFGGAAIALQRGIKSVHFFLPDSIRLCQVCAIKCAVERLNFKLTGIN